MLDPIPFVLVLLAAACAHPVAPAPATESEAVSKPGIDHSAFDALLRAHVRDERVDYLVLRTRDWAALTAYLDEIASVEPDGLARDDRLAFYINLYNASMIRAAARLYRDVPRGTWEFFGYDEASTSWRVFDDPYVRLDGREISLNALKAIIRSEYPDEPRIHVALVCGARSCPPLIPRAYAGADVDTVLEDRMRHFVTGGTRNRFDHVARTMELSQLFEWYADDFGGRAALPDLIGRSLGRDVSGYETSYLEYDWSLNIAPAATGRWLRVEPETEPLFAGPTGDDRVGFAGAGDVFQLLRTSKHRVAVARPFDRGEAWIRAESVRSYDAR